MAGQHDKDLAAATAAAAAADKLFFLARGGSAGVHRETVVGH
jgi:hypothetical protein